MLYALDVQPLSAFSLFVDLFGELKAKLCIILIPQGRLAFFIVRFVCSQILPTFTFHAYTQLLSCIASMSLC